MQGVCTPPPRDDLRFSNTTCILQRKTMWFIGVAVEQETSAPPPQKNPGSAPVKGGGGGRKWEIEVHQKTIVTQGRREGNYLTSMYLRTLDK